MSQPRFVHLHTHTEYSLLDGANRIKPLVQKVASLGMPALAITDHGVMSGAIEFYEACLEAGIKPIIGCEVYVAPRKRTDRDPRKDSSAFHLLLLAKNLSGYKNLIRLSTIASLEGFYYKPRVDHEALQQYSEGLIATSGCLSSEVCVALINRDYERALRIAGFYRDLFGKENYFIELQDHGLSEQQAIREGLIKLSRDLGVPLICTNDVHYLNADDARAHDVLLCVQTGKTVNEEDRLRYGSNEFYLKTPEEMARLFPDHPEALENTLRIMEMVDLRLDFGRVHLPEPDLPPGHTAISYLTHLARQGMQQKYHPVTPEVEQRLAYELEVIDKTGFAPYFLIVHDFAQFARDRGIFFGVRGSAAGSMVSYCVGITDIDPLYYGLTFERFLNPERVQMPDIDMDFEDTRRDEVIRYVTEKYGEDRVAQIGTFGTLGAKQAVRDVGKALGIPAQTVDQIARLIPIGSKVTIDSALKANPELRELIDNDSRLQELIEIAQRLEGVARHMSTHAAGVVISRDPLTEHVPLARVGDGPPVTQYDMGALEKIGLLKMDFLGLTNLTILAKTLQNIERTRGKRIDLHDIPLDDRKTYEMLGQGDTTGVFQLESQGMRRNIAELKPNDVRELAAMVALYRPGPMDHIPRYIRCKLGLQPIEYPHPSLEPILEETYGVIVYQDQVLQTVRALAGFTLGQADILRRAIGKKKAEDMEKMRSKFIEGAVRNGISEKQAEKLYELIEPFAGYAFNKAHAVCYAMVAYQTAYLKANYPVEYFAALMAAHFDNQDKVVQYVEECRRRNIQILPPDINRSDADFTVEGDAIRFGLGAIKNVGKAAVEVILRARADKPFASLFDFCVRTLEQQGNFGKSTVETLIQAGAFHCLVPNRNQLLTALEDTWAAAQRAVHNRRIGQESLFTGGQMEQVAEPPLPHVPEFSREQILAFEKELLGVYLADHPLRSLQTRMKHLGVVPCNHLREVADGAQVRVAGVITSVRHLRTKRGDRMAAVVLEDLTGTLSATAFPNVYEEHKHLLMKDNVVVLEGRVKYRDRLRAEDSEHGETQVQVELICERAQALTNGITPGGNGGNNGNGRQRTARTLHIRLTPAHRPALRVLREILTRHPGEARLVLHVHSGKQRYRVVSHLNVDVSDNTQQDLVRIVGRDSVWLQ
ncbi:MAG: DNA polymerase III subunit alpha [bacterium]|nr:DNA polymerase III subunit alpha [bacterium]